jgi:hypothetical protein
MISGQRGHHLKSKYHQILSSLLTWLITKVIPYCRPWGGFHEELTCPVFLEICGDEGFSQSEKEQVNMCGRKYNVGMNEWMELTKHGRDVNCMNDVVDKAIENFGPKPNPK